MDNRHAPKEPEPIFFPKRYFPPTLRSILGAVLSAVVGKWYMGCGDEGEDGQNGCSNVS